MHATNSHTVRKEPRRNGALRPAQFRDRRPPHRDFHVKYVFGLMPCLWMISATATPASPSFRMLRTCSSVKRDFRVPWLPLVGHRESPRSTVYAIGELMCYQIRS
jgi:hypothetical protein